jgi:uncharacterized SAM-binding protein YcdF (DUF218 family)
MVVAAALMDMQRWRMSSPPLNAASGATIIALNGGGNDDSLLDVYSLDRLITATELAKRTPGATIVTTRNRDHGLTTDADQRRMIALAGLTDRWTILDGVQHTTRDEAVTLRAARPELKSVVVVTSPMHSRRACAVFEGVGFSVTCVPSLERNRSWYRDLDQYVYERLAWALYRHRGWVQ